MYTTKQMKKWEEEFGKAYADRNPFMPEETDKLYTEKLYGVSRTEMKKH